MALLPAAFSLSPKTPSEVNRFAPGNSIQINKVSTSTLQVQLISRSALTTPTQNDTESAGILTHPEDSFIFHFDIVVSTQKITERHIALADHILNHCGDSAASVPVTIFIEISEHDHRADYYVIAHPSKTITWIVDQAPESFEGATQAKHEHEYWIHMENFPGPHFSTPEDLRSLKHVLGSNAIDVLTSEGSTSPMSVEQIKTHLAMLDSFSGEGDVYQTYAVARLWNLTLQSRVINKYGTPAARPNRFASIIDNQPTLGGTYTGVAKLMFNQLYVHLGRCFRAWVNRIIYPEEWRMSNVRQSTFGAPESVDEVVIGSATSVEEIIGALTERGCRNLTSVINLTTCSNDPHTGGGFCDVYLGAMCDGTKVAIKSLRVYGSQSEGKTLKRAARELYHWSKLNHPNVLPLMGLAVFRGRMSMISEWMENGDLMAYLKRKPDANRVKLCIDVCEGLCYIHTSKMVHGDLKGVNVMISSNGEAIIADFGNAYLRDLTLKFSNTSHGYSTRWAAPEVLEGGGPNKEADVYAYGMTVLEALTGKAPYHEHTGPQVICLVTVKNRVPPRPSIGICDELWQLLNSCWARAPSERPRITSIRDRLGALVSRHTPIHTCNQCGQVPSSSQIGANLKSAAPLEQGQSCSAAGNILPALQQVGGHDVPVGLNFKPPLNKLTVKQSDSTRDANPGCEESEFKKNRAFPAKAANTGLITAAEAANGESGPDLDAAKVHRRGLNPAQLFRRPFNLRTLIPAFIVLVLCGLCLGAFGQPTSLGPSAPRPIVNPKEQEIQRLRELLEDVGQSLGELKSVIYCGRVLESDKGGNVQSQNTAELNVELRRAHIDCFIVLNTSNQGQTSTTLVAGTMPGTAGPNTASSAARPNPSDGDGW